MRAEGLTEVEAASVRCGQFEVQERLQLETRTVIGTIQEIRVEEETLFIQPGWLALMLDDEFVLAEPRPLALRLTSLARLPGNDSCIEFREQGRERFLRLYRHYVLEHENVGWRSGGGGEDPRGYLDVF